MEKSTGFILGGIVGITTAILGYSLYNKTHSQSHPKIN